MWLAHYDTRHRTVRALDKFERWPGVETHRPPSEHEAALFLMTIGRYQDRTDVDVSSLPVEWREAFTSADASLTKQATSPRARCLC